MLNRSPGGPAYEGLTPTVSIPEDPAVAKAERLGLAPLDHRPDSPAMVAMRELAKVVRRPGAGVASGWRASTS